MAKVVTSEGLQDYISTGKPTETFENPRKKLAEKISVVDAPKPAEPAKDAPPPPEPPPATEDTGLEPEDHDLAERARKRISKKHYEMTKAQKEATEAKAALEESERFAEMLFNEREQLRKKTAALESAPPAKPKEEAKPPEAPKREAFVSADGQSFDWDGYEKARDEYAAQKALTDAKKAADEERSKAAQAAAEASMKARIAAATLKYPDWERVVTTSAVTLPNEALRFLGESEYGMDIAYLLANDVKQAEKIRTLSPALAIAALGKLETQFEKPAPPSASAAPEAVPTKTTGAPAPITPISTSGTGNAATTDPSKMDFKQLRQWHKDRKKAGIER